MKPLSRLAIGFLILGTILAFIPKNTTKPYKLSPEQLLLQIKTGTHFISPDEIADKLIKKDPSIQLIDVRSSKEFAQFNLPGSINIPLQKILSDKFAEQFDQDTKQNILYSNGSTDAVQAWMILRQLGKQNVYVLQGGLNYWAETIMNPKAPKSINANDEIAKYNFRKGANMALGGANLTATSGSTGGSKPASVAGGTPKKKKGASGGC